MKTIIRLLGIVSIATASAGMAAALDETQPNVFRAVTSGNSGWVAVDSQGHLLTSSNRVDWNSTEIGADCSFNAAAFGNGRFVAVGDEGSLLTSDDGAYWTKRNSDTDDCLRGVAFGNGVFVAVGKCGTMVTSKDGLRWRFSGISTRLKALAFGHGRFVAVGQAGGIFTSSKGLDWKKSRSVSASNLSNVTFENESFVATDVNQNRMTSPDGVVWSSSLQQAALR